MLQSTQLQPVTKRDLIDAFQNHAYYGTFPVFAILYGATVNAKQLLSRKKGYSTVTIAGKQAKVTCHNFSSESNRSKRKQWIRYYKGRRQAFKARLKWTKICSLQDMSLDDRYQRFP